MKMPKRPKVNSACFQKPVKYGETGDSDGLTGNTYTTYDIYLKEIGLISPWHEVQRRYVYPMGEKLFRFDDHELLV